MTNKIDGKDLIAWGFRPGPWFQGALEEANRIIAANGTRDDARAAVAALAPEDRKRIPYRKPGDAPAYTANIEPENDAERDNVAMVKEAMDALMRVPTVKAGTIMPDACPAGTIPVGGVVATENAIHPGFHSSDICCSLAITVLGNRDPAKVMDIAQKVTHFGPGGRKPGSQLQPPSEILEQFTANPFLRQLEDDAVAHFGTQGDGNHFLFVGHVKSTGQLAIVTHHGSRKPGAMLYKRGMAAAEKVRRALSPETPKGAAWLPFDTDEGRTYWDALQTIRLWTRENHYAIHDLICREIGASRSDRWWNEHNFVFRRDDGRFYHAKGATPSFDGFSPDDAGLTLIPMNMAEPILITAHVDQVSALGFAPHGAGRNMSRTRYLRDNEHISDEQMVKDQTEGVDARFWCGIPDPSELPGAYKSADSVRRQITDYSLAEVVDEILPYGSIMAGNWQKPFRERRKAAKDGR